MIRIPVAQTPTDIPSSVHVGQYSKTLSKGFGTKPPTTRPKPLSIQVDITTDTQATIRIFSFLLAAGMIRITRATSANTTAVHIKGTSLPSPTNRY